MVEGDIPNFIRVEIEEGSKSGKECLDISSTFWSQSMLLT